MLANTRPLMPIQVWELVNGKPFSSASCSTPQIAGPGRHSRVGWYGAPQTRALSLVGPPCCKTRQPTACSIELYFGKVKNSAARQLESASPGSTDAQDSGMQQRSPQRARQQACNTRVRSTKIGSIKPTADPRESKRRLCSPPITRTEKASHIGNGSPACRSRRR